MNWPAILKLPLSGKATPNLCGYAQTCADFSREQARAKHIAWRWLGKAGGVRDFTFADVRDATNRFAKVLNNLEVPKGDRVFVLARRIPELCLAALGTLKNQSLLCPLFSAFGPESIRS